MPIEYKHPDDESHTVPKNPPKKGWIIPLAGTFAAFSLLGLVLEVNHETLSNLFSQAFSAEKSAKTNPYNPHNFKYNP